MRTTVQDEGRHFDRQTHAYAEYRVFSRLMGAAGVEGDVTVLVALKRLDGDAPGAPLVRCEIAVAQRASEVARVQALGPHPYAAIDRAAVLIGEAVRRQAQRSRATAG